MFPHLVHVQPQRGGGQQRGVQKNRRALGAQVRRQLGGEARPGRRPQRQRQRRRQVRPSVPGVVRLNLNTTVLSARYSLSSSNLLACCSLLHSTACRRHVVSQHVPAPRCSKGAHLDLQGCGVEQQPAPGQESVARGVVHQPPRHQCPARRRRAVEAQLQGQLQLLHLLRVAPMHAGCRIPDARASLMTASRGDTASSSHMPQQAAHEMHGLAWPDLTAQLPVQQASIERNARQEYEQACSALSRAPLSLRG
jgi:hypothetical protein